MRRDPYPTLGDERALAEAITALSGQCRIMRKVSVRTGQPPLRAFPANFEGLAKIVTGQQVSASAAAAIWAKVSSGVQPFTPKRVLAHTGDSLKMLGLSAPKVKTLLALADAAQRRDLDFARLNTLADDDIREQLTRLHGIGPWTADIYLLFALRRADAFPAGDLALQIAAGHLFKLESRPSASELEDLSQRWRPWRGAAARLLWADYALQRQAKAVSRSARKPVKL